MSQLQLCPRSLLPDIPRLRKYAAHTRSTGFIPAGFDFNPNSAQLTAVAKELESARSVLGLTELTLTPAPVGVGFLTCHESVGLFRQNVLPILEKYSKQAKRHSLPPPPFLP